MLDDREDMAVNGLRSGLLAPQRKQAANSSGLSRTGFAWSTNVETGNNNNKRRKERKKEKRSYDASTAIKNACVQKFEIKTCKHPEEERLCPDTKTKACKYPDENQQGPCPEIKKNM